LQHVAAAEKYLETSAWKLKFSPDWDSAANEFSKAAVAFKIARDWVSCKGAHLRASESFANSGSLFHAGKQLEQCLLVLKEQGDLSEVEELASRGGLLYRQAGSPESASQLLVRAAKMLELALPERAILLYERAGDTVGTEDRPAEAAQHLEQAARLATRVGQWDRAVSLLESSLSLWQEGGAASAQGKLVIALVLLHIKRGDCVGGSKAWGHWGGLCDGGQAAAVGDILQGFSEQDGELAARGLASAVVRALDNDYVKLGRGLELPSVGEEEELDLC